MTDEKGLAKQRGRRCRANIACSGNHGILKHEVHDGEWLERRGKGEVGAKAWRMPYLGV